VTSTKAEFLGNFFEKKKEKKNLLEKKYLKFAWKFTFMMNSDGKISTFIGLVCVSFNVSPKIILTKSVNQYSEKPS